MAQARSTIFMAFGTGSEKYRIPYPGGSGAFVQTIPCGDKALGRPHGVLAALQHAAL